MKEVVRVLLLVLLLSVVVQGACYAKVLRIYSGSININQASAADLTRLPGVGEVIAFRIVKEREKRGKFSSLAELKEIKGISGRLFEGFRSYATLDGKNDFKVYLDLNSVTKPLLLGLPNMSEGEAQSILNYRRLNGKYKATEDLLKVPGIDRKRLAELSEWLAVAP